MPNPQDHLGSMLSWHAVHTKPQMGCQTVYQYYVLRYFRYLKTALVAPNFPLRTQVQNCTDLQTLNAILGSVEMKGGRFHFSGCLPRRAAWHTTGQAVKAMEEAYLQFARHNRSLRNAIINTGDSYIFFDSGHPYWGLGTEWDPSENPKPPIVGMDGGTNWLGVVLMLCRTILLEEMAGDEQQQFSENRSEAGTPDDEGEGPRGQQSGVPHAGGAFARPPMNYNAGEGPGSPTGTAKSTNVMLSGVGANAGDAGIEFMEGDDRLASRGNITRPAVNLAPEAVGYVSREEQAQRAQASELYDVLGVPERLDGRSLGLWGQAPTSAGRAAPAATQTAPPPPEQRDFEGLFEGRISRTMAAYNHANHAAHHLADKLNNIRVPEPAPPQDSTEWPDMPASDAGTTGRQGATAPY